MNPKHPLRDMEGIAAEYLLLGKNGEWIIPARNFTPPIIPHRGRKELLQYRNVEVLYLPPSIRRMA